MATTTDVVPPPTEVKQTAHFARHWHAGLGRRRRLIEAHAEAGSSRSSAHRHLTS